MCTICCGIFPNIQCDMYTQCIFNLICFIQLHQVMIEFKELIDREAKKYGRNKQTYFAFTSFVNSLH